MSHDSATRSIPTTFTRAVLGAVLAILLCGGVPALAQSTGSAIQGTVTDEQGAIMPGAAVIVANVQTGCTRDVVTDERGWYRATGDPARRLRGARHAAGLRHAGSPRLDRDDRAGGHGQRVASAREPRGIGDRHRRGAAGRDDAQHAGHDGDARIARQPAAHQPQLRRTRHARARRHRRRRRRRHRAGPDRSQQQLHGRRRQQRPDRHGRQSRRLLARGGARVRGHDEPVLRRVWAVVGRRRSP